MAMGKKGDGEKQDDSVRAYGDGGAPGILSIGG